jgi:hypothetical protein
LATQNNGPQNLGPRNRNRVVSSGVIGNTGRSCAEKKPSGVIIAEAHGTPVVSATSRAAHGK